ncbi:MAG TPA: LCP family protein [Chloroflexota bacterium]|nr:LCP family protein [Chloroflexota bacterium]
MSVTVLAVINAVLPLPSPLDHVVAGLGTLPLLVLSWLLAAEWESVWGAIMGANVLIGLLRAWISLDAAGAAKRLARSTGLNAGRSGYQSWSAAFLAGMIVLVPHLMVYGAASFVRPAFLQIPAKIGKQPPSASTGMAGIRLAPEEEGRPVWDGRSRLNVLLLGTDRRPQEAEEEPWGNSDTLLLVSVDPNTRSTVMVSLPRDLYLPIPGIGPEKINAAYREGGPSLAVRVVSDLLGQPIHRWASVDVSAFARMIDAVGGVVVDIERPIRDDEYPAENYAVRRIYLPAGLQWLNGEQALWYARSRHSSDDFDRSARQQALLLALKDRAQDRRIVSRLPALFSSLIDAVQTDISPREALALVTLGTTSELRSNRLVLTPPLFGSEIIRPNLYAIEPNVPRIRAAVAEAMVSGNTAQAVVAGTSDPLSQGGDPTAGSNTGFGPLDGASGVVLP